MQNNGNRSENRKQIGLAFICSRYPTRFGNSRCLNLKSSFESGYFSRQSRFIKTKEHLSSKGFPGHVRVSMASAPSFCFHDLMYQRETLFSTGMRTRRDATRRDETRRDETRGRQARSKQGYPSPPMGKESHIHSESNLPRGNRGECH